ncbi:hypothetical protein [Wenxinia marina]|uniref:Uncharacterized protein n=1 Tax=Wenxinia marina DSM 24838 TaxID=1123501 RepID=A0A0D0QCM7_9RHOB|nr:hypothetical protein [Wenxinia marina]KIQ68683.1 hypothetical protein Wenmar_02954 [Wenxinia marina DSM 24838]GGL67897.1 hypothetical protein GCM10011392_22970 [Wenxinia marina]
MVVLGLAVAPFAAAAQSLTGWELAGVGWAGRGGTLELDRPERGGERVARFLWAGEGAGDLTTFDFAGACDLIADLFGRIEAAGGAAAPERIRIEAAASTGGVIRLSRSVRMDFEVAGGRCIAAGEGVEL